MVLEGISFTGVRLSGKPSNTFWDVSCSSGRIDTIKSSGETQNGDAERDGRLLTPSLCHPHIHLDKCFLLSHPKYADLEIQSGDFSEALKLTSKAKSRFEHSDLMERGRALIEESISFGVTHMRAFVEVDRVVGVKCLEAGLSLKAEFEDRCNVQLCAFAQDPIFPYDDEINEMCALMEKAAALPGITVVGSTPYVENSVENQRRNIKWMVDLAKKFSLHLDFHLDYNLDAKLESMVPYVVKELKEASWSHKQAVALGHCTRLTMFTASEWKSLRNEIGDLPISFVGLPTSDLFMMGRPDGSAGGGHRLRGTLQIPQMIKKYGFQAAVGINNVGNAFTPQGSCDPLSVASLGVGIYQASTKEDVEVLFECVSNRARSAIGFESHTGLELREMDAADFVAFGTPGGAQIGGFRHRRTVQDLVYDACRERTTILGGGVVSS